MSRAAIAAEAGLELQAGTDTAAPGGVITVELCGHWEHDGPCRWPHNTAIDSSADPARLRIILVTTVEDLDGVLARIETALRHDDRWRVLSFDVRPIADDELAMAERLTQL